jgi:hypothetical protein
VCVSVCLLCLLCFENLCLATPTLLGYRLGSVTLVDVGVGVGVLGARLHVAAGLGGVTTHEQVHHNDQHSDHSHTGDGLGVYSDGLLHDRDGTVVDSVAVVGGLTRGGEGGGGNMLNRWNRTQ